MPSSDMNRVFFERSGTCRTVAYALCMVVFGTAGLFGLISAAWQMARDGFPWQHLLGVIFVGLWTAAMSGIAAAIGWGFFFRPETHSRIDGSGIHIDSKHWAWNDVAVIFSKGDGAGDWLCFHGRGLFSMDHMIHPLPHLPPAEAEQILFELDGYLTEHFPDVRIIY